VCAGAMPTNIRRDGHFVCFDYELRVANGAKKVRDRAYCRDFDQVTKPIKAVQFV